MAISGLGQNGCIRVQKEAVYGTPIATSQTYLPLVAGTIKHIVEHIEKQNLINSRITQSPQLGRKISGGDELTFEVPPELMGMYLELALGASDDDVDTPVAGADTHNWQIPIDGENCGASWTVEQFIGNDTGEQFAGVKCTKFVINWDSQGTVKFMPTLVGVDLNDNAVTRPTTITISANEYYTFANMLIQLTPASVSQFTQKTNSGSIEVDFGYLDGGQRFQAGSATAGTPIFGTIPSVTVTLNIDAEKRFENWSQEKKSFKLDISATSDEIITGTTAYAWAFEAGAMILNQDVSREQANDNLSMDLVFKVADGATTTNSGTDVVQAEFRVIDDVTAYAG